MKVLNFVQISIIATLNCFSLVHMDEIESSIYKLENEKSNTVDMLVKWHAESLAKCCALCCNIKCRGIYYHRNKRKCITKSNMSVTESHYEDGWKFYSRTVLNSRKGEPYRLYTHIPESTTDIYGYATSVCNTDGSQLVQIRNQTKHNFVKSFIEVSLVSGKIPAPDPLYIFIDGRIGNDSMWYFYNGEQVPYLDWAPNQPNNFEWQTYGNQTFLTLNQGADYKMNDYWNTRYASDGIWFLCEL